MDHWILALRGDGTALGVANGLLGSSAPVAGPLSCHDLETFHAHTFAEILLRVRDGAEVAVGVSLDTSTSAPNDARERAMAIALAARPGSVLADSAARERLEGEVLFVHANPRPGWRPSVHAVELAKGDARRTACWEQVRRLLIEPPLVARARELAALRSAIEGMGAVVLRADAGMGARRLLREVALRQKKSWLRITPRRLALPTPELLEKLEADPHPWLLLDPVPAHLRDKAQAVVEKLGRSKVVVLRVLPEVTISFVPLGRQIALTPLRPYDARRLLRSMLGPRVTVQFERRLLRRAGAVPRRLVECVRASVQLGELRYEGNELVEREPRPLRLRSALEDPLALRVAALPAPLHRALRVLHGLGDGASEAEARSTLRALLSEAPERMLSSLSELGLVAVEGGAMVLGVTMTQQALLPEPRITAAAQTGALDLAAVAEAQLARGERAAAAHGFLAAARAALEGGRSAVALRLAVAARQCVERPDEAFSTALAEVLSAAGPLVQFELPGAGAGATGRRKALTLDALRLEEAAALARDRQDSASASRLETLAELVKGNTAEAQKRVHGGGEPQSGRDQLVAALAHGAGGDLPRAVRTAATVLVGARQRGEKAAEAAAIAVLSALYRAAGREEDSRTLAEGARKLRADAATSGGA